MASDQESFAIPIGPIFKDISTRTKLPVSIRVPGPDDYEPPAEPLLQSLHLRQGDHVVMDQLLRVAVLHSTSISKILYSIFSEHKGRIIVDTQRSTRQNIPESSAPPSLIDEERNVIPPIFEANGVVDLSPNQLDSTKIEPAPESSPGASFDNISLQSSIMEALGPSLVTTKLAHQLKKWKGLVSRLPVLGERTIALPRRFPSSHSSELESDQGSIKKRRLWWAWKRLRKH